MAARTMFEETASDTETIYYGIGTRVRGARVRGAKGKCGVRRCGVRKCEEPLNPEPWNPGTLEPWNPGTLELWNSGTFVHGIAEISIRSIAIVEISIGMATTSGETSSAASSIGAVVSGCRSESAASVATFAASASGRTEG